MASKQAVVDIKKYIESFDLYFLSFSALKDRDHAKVLADNLLGFNIKLNSIFINKQTKDKIDTCAYKDVIEPLFTNKLVIEQYFSISYEFFIKKMHENNKRRKVLLITLDDQEGFSFERLDALDNHINDLDAVSFDLSGNFFQYMFKAPKEDIVFNIVTDKQVEWLKVLFYKTEISGYYSALYEKSNQKTSASKTNDSYRYVIDKSELFERDKVCFIVRINGKELTSAYCDFYFGKKQEWFLQIGSDQIKAKNEEKKFITPEPQKPTPPTQVIQSFEQETTSSVVPESEKFNYYGDLKNPRKIESIREDKIVSKLLDVKMSDAAKMQGIQLKTDRGIIVKVGDLISDRGGEGAVYRSSQPGMVIKLYWNECRNIYRREKIEYMTKKRINHPNVVWPQDSLYDMSGVFVGYQMRMIKTDKGKSDLQKIFANQAMRKSLKKIDIVNTIASICGTLEYLHQRNIVLCDIKLDNFVISSEDLNKGSFNNILFVDCDSYQIDKFSHNVMSQGFIAPEYRPGYYRTLEYDRYSLFVLIFKMLFDHNKHPYARVYFDNEEQLDMFAAAKAGLFPYFLEDNGNTEKLTPGVENVRPLADYWSHLPKYVKQALIDVGDKKRGKNYLPEKRKTAREWQKIFNCYANDIVNGKLKADKDYNVGYPRPRIPYSLVDIEMIREMVERITKVSLSSAIMESYRRANLKCDKTTFDTALHEVSYNKYYNDTAKKFSITLIKYLGIQSVVEVKYLS